jgi:hypothetical protein
MIPSVIKQGFLLETVNEIEPFTLIGIRNKDSMPKFIKIMVPTRCMRKNRQLSVMALYMYQMVKVRSVGLVYIRDSEGTVSSVYSCQ